MRTQVALLTVVALGIRLVIVRGFWLDEATSGYDARLSYSGMLQQLVHDNHPPLEYSILWLVAHTVGSTQTDLRLPSILFGTLTIPMLYFAGRALYNERAGVLAAAFGTVGALAVWYAQEARMYALFMLLATVTIWAQAKILSSPHRRYWLGWVAASAAMIWTQWFASLAVGAEVLIFAWWLTFHPIGRQNRKPFAVALAGIIVLCAPGIPLLITQFRNNQANGLGFGGRAGSGTTGGFSPYGIFNNVVWAVIGYHSNAVVASIVAVWPLGILGALVVLGRRRHRANRQLVALIAIPMAITFLASANVAPSRSLFEVRYFIEAVPALYLLLAGAVCTMTAKVWARRGLGGALFAVLAVGLVLQQTDSANPRLYGYDTAFRHIAADARPGDEILYAPGYLNVDVSYFAPHTRAEPATALSPDLPASAQVFVVGSFNFAGSDLANTNTQRLLTTLEARRHLNAVVRAPNVTVWEFS